MADWAKYAMVDRKADVESCSRHLGKLSCLDHRKSAILLYMAYLSSHTDRLPDHKELYQFLVACQQASLEKGCTQIASISVQIPRVDPLAVLQILGGTQSFQFYLEKRKENEAILAIDATIYAELEGINRFQHAKSVIHNYLKDTWIWLQQNQTISFSGPHFFCFFTFFALNQPSPFRAATIFLPRWQVAFRGNSGTVVANVQVDPHVNIKRLLQDLYNQIAEIKFSEHKPSSLTRINCSPFIPPKSINTEAFKSAVVAALNFIDANEFSKIVLANAVDIFSHQPFNLVHSLDNLRQRHPDCYIFCASNGKGQNFLGASPERLISIRDHLLVTDALAGSAPRGRTASEDAEFGDRLLGSEKEQREHQFVLDFITQRLSELGLIPQYLPAPQLLKLSNIQHLWTPIQTQLFTNVHPLDIVAQLHPTPAVAGVPTQIAQEQIRRYETFDRSLYAAPLGWIDYQGNCEFIVGIRSALIDSNPSSLNHDNTYRARLYAGAGIVAGSDPDKELAEIQLKLQALLKALL